MRARITSVAGLQAAHGRHTIQCRFIRLAFVRKIPARADEQRHAGACGP